MKAILEFDLNDPDEAAAHKRAVLALDMMMCLHDVKEQFRSKIKYDDKLTEDELKGWEDAREMFIGTLTEYNIDLNRL
jgi:hypothetical protein